MRKALQFVERRQRNRVAIERSPYESLEAALELARDSGLTRELTEEISYMSGIKPATGAQILTDKGGEAIAVLCKSTGLKRDMLANLMQALRRPLVDDTGEPHPDYQRVMEAYDTISVDKAQTVLRYWNWSLTASLNEDVIQYIKKGTIPREEEHGAAAITAALVFGNRHK